MATEWVSKHVIHPSSREEATGGKLETDASFHSYTINAYMQSPKAVLLLHSSAQALGKAIPAHEWKTNQKYVEVQNRRKEQEVASI